MAEGQFLKQRVMAWLEQRRQHAQEPQGPEATMSLQEQLEVLGHRVDALTTPPVAHALAQVEAYLRRQSYTTRNDNVTMHNVWMDIGELAEAQRWQYEKAIAQERQAPDMTQRSEDITERIAALLEEAQRQGLVVTGQETPPETQALKQHKRMGY